MCGFNSKLKSLKNIEYETEYDLKKLSSFGIGGVASIVVFPKTKVEFIQALSIFPEAVIIGNGTNILFSDNGVSRPIITTRRICDSLHIENDRVIVGAGTSLTTLCVECMKNNLGGLENMYGIPATIGGAIYMNAGAFGTEMASVVESVQVFNNGRVEKIDANKIKFAYRYSSFQEKDCIILEATLKLHKADKLQLEEKIKQNILWRSENQPNGKSAGSVFKKSVKPAGILIEQAGLKGQTVGGAIVSKKHANFIINYSNASAKDVLGLIKLMKDKVYIEHGILLEEEIIYIGE